MPWPAEERGVSTAQLAGLGAVALHPVNHRTALRRWHCNRAAVVLDQLVKLPPRMHWAIRRLANVQFRYGLGRVRRCGNDLGLLLVIAHDAFPLFKVVYPDAYR